MCTTCLSIFHDVCLPNPAIDPAVASGGVSEHTIVPNPTANSTASGATGPDSAAREGDQTSQAGSSNRTNGRGR
jgi:hypothetical protein